MKNKYERGNIFQTTFHMGSGPNGRKIADLLEQMADVLEETDAATLRIGLRVLAKLPATHPAIKESKLEEAK